MCGNNFQYIEIHPVDYCNNNCRWCNNHAPFIKSREQYSAGQYIRWLDKLIEAGFDFGDISIMGGEPFLHDNLTGFVYELRKHYPQRRILLSTNGFWLSDEDIKAYSSVFAMINVVFISIYPNLLPSLGGLDEVLRLKETLRANHPHLHIDYRDKNEFRTIDYLKEPVEIASFCGTSSCTKLLPDGTMARCGVGAFAAQNPNVSEEFLQSKHMFFDLKKGTQNFAHWRNRWPLDACYYCTSYQWNITSWKAEKGTKRDKSLEHAHHVRTGELLAATGQLTEAKVKCLKTLKKFPDSSKVLTTLGAVYFYSGHTEKAKDCFISALKKDPDCTEAKQNLRQIT